MNALDDIPGFIFFEFIKVKGRTSLVSCPLLKSMSIPIHIETIGHPNTNYCFHGNQRMQQKVTKIQF